MSETLTRIFFEFLSLSKNLLVLFIGITLLLTSFKLMYLLTNLKN